MPVLGWDATSSSEGGGVVKRREEEMRDGGSGGRTSHGSADGINIVAMITDML